MKFLKTTAAIVAITAALWAGVQAYGYYSTVFPLFATAGETCYQLEPGTQVIGLGNRPDYLAAYTKSENGKVVALCFLRPPVSNPNWEAR